MNRYLITTPIGTVHLYYPNIETAKSIWGNVTIEPCENNDFLKYINSIIEISNLIGFDYKGRPTYKMKFPLGDVTVKFGRYDNEYVDFCLYQFFPIGRLIAPVTWTISTPKEVWEEFSATPGYKELSWCCKSKGQKIQKPKELKGVSPIGSVPFSKTSCGIFIKGNDIYINHRDYFSPSLKVADEDIGKPLSFLVEKYCGRKKADKFIYCDGWGDIVLQNIAWLKFENVIKLIKEGYGHNVAIWMRDMVFKNLGFKNTEGGYMEWLDFFNCVCDMVKIKT